MTSFPHPSESSGSSGRLTLEIWRGDVLDEVVVVQPGLTVGRAGHNAIPVDEPEVDPIHARVLRGESGTYEMAGASPGSLLLNLETKQAVGRIVLQDGTEIRVGSVKLCCRQIRSAKETGDGEEWAERCPKCHAPMENPGIGDKDCPDCHFPLRWVESGGFAGWLPCEVGPYEVRAFVAQDGMGLVTRALHRKYAIRVVVKFPLLPSGQGQMARFDREVAILRALEHPNLVGMREAGHEGKLAWLAHDWIEGESLAELMARKKTSGESFTIEKIDDVIAQIARGLVFLHGKGIVHRNLEPSNILIGRNDAVMLADFSLTRSLLPGENTYCSPEQSSGQEITTASDIYSLGAVWYELLTGLTMRPHVPPGECLRQDCSAEYSGRVISCLLGQPEDRPKAEDFAQKNASQTSALPPTYLFDDAEGWLLAKNPSQTSALSPTRDTQPAVKCPKCTSVLAGTPNGCEFCGFQFDTPQRKPKSTGTFVVRVLLLGVAISIIAMLVIFLAADKSDAGAAAATKEQPFVNSLGMKFVPVAGTKVLFGVWDTRVQDYEVFAKETKREWPKPSFQQEPTHPVVDVSWEDAKAFCAWLSRKEGQTYRLPKDAEWSAAVGLSEEGGGTPKEKDGKVAGYPWGPAWPPPRGVGNYASLSGVDDFLKTSPMGSFAANQYGLYDMGGNVWQWCEDWHDANRTYRVLRGGSWRDIILRSSFRERGLPTYRDDDRGFRCVLVVSGS